jgi:hypothetical protein
MVIFYIKRQTDFNICLCEDSTYYKPEWQEPDGTRF